MKLKDLEKKNVPTKALKESFAINFNVSNLDRAKTRSMLNKISKLINEAKRSPDFHRAQSKPTYMKLKFMEQALTQHLPVAKAPRIVFENEEVEKSQVILAAQDLIDTIQKYYEDVNDMLVKELPALVDSIESEIGVNESIQYNRDASTSLTALNSALLETKTSLQSALAGLTGQGGVEAFDSDSSDLDTDLDADLGAELGDEDGLDLDIDDSENDLSDLSDLDTDDEDEITGIIGRAKR